VCLSPAELLMITKRVQSLVAVGSLLFGVLIFWLTKEANPRLVVKVLALPAVGLSFFFLLRSRKGISWRFGAGLLILAFWASAFMR
jgi:hypothetical protein